MIERFEKFSFAISEISRHWHRIASDEMQKYGLKSPHAIYLTTMYHYDEGIHAARLGELCGKDKSDVSRMMSIMEKKGLIVKEGEGAYRALIKLTEEGKCAAEHVRERAIVAVANAGRGVSEENRKIFYDVLAVIAANLSALSEEGLPQQ
jgi:DNA-binding MarR family transcriptional regulator